MLGVGLAKPDFSVDLFVIANNRAQVDNLKFLDEPRGQGTIEALLWPLLKPLCDSQTQFLLIDGRDCSIFGRGGPQRPVAYIQRKYSSYVSRSETTRVGGIVKSRVLERTASTQTDNGGFTTRPIGPSECSARGYIYFNTPFEENARKDLFMAVQDPNSYRSSQSATMEQDRLGLDQTLCLSSNSVDDTQRFLNDLGFNGVAICGYGLVSDPDSNFVAFPPAGVIAHYTLFHESRHWYLHLVGYTRSSERL